MASHNLPYERLGLTPMQERFCLAVLTTDTFAEAARAVHVTTRCASKWMKEPAILSRIKQARKLAFEQAIGQIQAATVDAVKLLRRVVNDESAAVGVRVRAADCILTHALGAQAVEELSEKITALESIVYSEQPSQRRAG